MRFTPARRPSTPAQSHAPATARALSSLVLGLVVAVVCSSPHRAQAATPSWHQTQFVIGTWQDPYPSPDDTTISNRNYRAISKAFFNLVTSAGGTAVDAATDVGLGYFSNLIGGQCAALNNNCPAAPPEPSAALQTISDYLGSLTDEQRQALAGFNLGDEPDTCWAVTARAWARAIHTADSTKAFYLNLYPGGAPVGHLLNPEYTDLFWNTGAPDEQPDVVSTDIYPWQNPPATNNHALTLLRMLYEHSHGKPFWMLTNAWDLNGGIGAVREPEENQLRWDVFAPTAYGAKGVLFIGAELNTCYQAEENPNYSTYPVFRNDWQSSPKAVTLRAIGHYMHDVLGPVVMSSAWVGVYHKTAHFSETDTTFRVYNEQVVSASKPIVESIGNDDVMVAVFKRFESPDTITYLLAVNKTLAAVTSDIGLDASYAGASVGAAASVVQYHGGQAFEPWTLSSGRVLTVSLAGGEGRLFRVVKPPHAGPYAKLTSPAGGEVWSPGDSKTISWTGLSSVTTCKLFTEPSLDTPELDGPSVTISLSVSGSSGTLTVPTVRSARAYLEVTGVTASGTTVRLSHPTPIVVAAAPTRTWGLFAVADAGGLAETALELPSNVPTVCWFGGSERRVHVSASSSGGSSWSTSLVTDFHEGDALNQNTCSYFTPNVGYGQGLAFTIDRSGHRHLSYGAAIWQAEGIRYREADVEACPASRSVVDGSTGMSLATTPAVARTSMAVDTFGTPYVTYRSAYGTAMTAVYKGGQWQEYGLSLSSPREPRQLVTRFDSRNRLWQAYISDVDHKLNIARKDSLVFSLQLNSPGTYRDVDMVADTGGVMHITYSQLTTTPGVQGLFYRRFNGSSLEAVQSIEQITGDISSVSIAMNAGVPCVAYATDGVIALATKGASGWSTETVVRTGDASSVCLRYTSGSTPVPWISYFDAKGDSVCASSIVSGGGGGGGGNNGGGRISDAVVLRSPNPMVRGGVLTFELRASRPTRLGLSLFDVAGRTVAERQNTVYMAGTHTLAWKLDGVRPGVYFVRATREGVRASLGSIVVLE